MRSCSQALQQHAYHCGIGATFNPHLCLPKLDVNRAGLGLGKIRDAMLDHDRRQCLFHDPPFLRDASSLPLPCD